MKVSSPDADVLPLDLVKRDLRLVVLEAPYDTIEDEGARLLLGKLFRLKIAGYKKEHPYGATPVDTGDFVGTHLILCEVSASGALEPLMGFKSVSWERCRIHKLEFPAFHLFPEEGFEEHRHAIQQILDWADRRGERAAYNGSWTVREDVKSDRTLMRLCYDITLLLLVRYYTDYGFSHVLAGATIRFKVERFKEFMGFEYLTRHGQRLPSFPCEPFFGEPVALMYLRRFSTDAHRLAKRYQALWDQRIVFRSQDLNQILPVKKVA